MPHLSENTIRSPFRRDDTVSCLPGHTCAPATTTGTAYAPEPCTAPERRPSAPRHHTRGSLRRVGAHTGEPHGLSGLASGYAAGSGSGGGQRRVVPCRGDEVRLPVVQAARGPVRRRSARVSP